MSETIQASPEFKPILTDPRQLLEANQTPDAQRNIQAYYEAKTNGELTGAFVCSDARVNMPAFLGSPTVTTWPSIATAGRKEPLRHSLRHAGIRELLVLQHHDGTARSSEMPHILHGCGGLAVKAERVRNGAVAAEDGVVGYVDNVIESPEVYTQAVTTALKIARLTDKPVLAGSVDHITGEILPFAVIRDSGRQIQASVAIYDWSNLDAIYRGGDIELIPEEELPITMVNLLAKNQEAIDELKIANAEVMRRQKVQSPSTVIISTSVIPASIRYPDLFQNPNTHFGVRVPFVKIGPNPSDIRLEDLDVKQAFAQAEYPIHHGAHAGPGEPFADTNTVIIETKNFDLSLHLAEKMSDLPWMKNWLGVRPENQIWVAQSQSGQTQKVVAFDSVTK